MSVRVAAPVATLLFSPRPISPVQPWNAPSAARSIAFLSRPSARKRPNLERPPRACERTVRLCFVPSSESRARSSRRRWVAGIAALAVVVFGLPLDALALWPRLKPPPLDPVERVSEAYLQSLIKGDETAQRAGALSRTHRRSVRSRRSIAIRLRNRTVKGRSPRWHDCIRGSDLNSLMILRLAVLAPRTRWARTASS